MNVSRSWLLSVMLVACGPVSAGAGLSEVESAIIGGTVDTADPAVVGFALGNGQQYASFCTGTLVAPKTVITAAHCIYAEGTQYNYYVLFGSTDSQPTQVIPVASQKKHPMYTGGNYDVGILELATPAVGVTPIEMNTTALGQQHVGQSIRHAGFGITAPNTNSGGTKREVTYTVRQVTPMTIESGASGKQTCQGDSGGPGLMVTAGSTLGRLVGVVSYGDADCAQFGVDMRVDTLVPWFQQQMSAWENPSCQLNGVCDAACPDLAFDPDCPKDCATNGICAIETCPRPDADCAATGAYCGSQLACKSRLCVSDDQHPATYCTQSCTANAECGTGLECAQGTCRFIQKPTRVLLESCTTSDFCTGGTVCSGPNNGLTRCVKPCTTNGDCSGDTCEGGQGGQRYCRPADVSFVRSISLAAAPLTAGPELQGCRVTGGPAWLAVLALLLLRRRGQA